MSRVDRKNVVQLFISLTLLIRGIDFLFVLRTVFILCINAVLLLNFKQAVQPVLRIKFIREFIRNVFRNARAL